MLVSLWAGLPVHASPIPVPPKLEVMAADGTNRRQMTEPLDYSARVSWAPDSRRVVTHAPGGLRIVDTATGEQTQLTEDLGVHPEWGPNEEIVYQRWTSSEDEWGISAVASDGANAREVLDTPASDTSPSWSPDGELIAFVSGPAEGVEGEVFTIAPDGSGLTQISTHGSYYVPPRWSPDGEWLLYTTFDSEIYAVRRDGSEERLITPDTITALYGNHGDWSPDGERIVFSGWSQSDAGEFVADGLWMASLDEPSPTFLRPGADPDWGLQGRIAFVSGFDIHLLDPDSEGVPNLTATEDSDESWPTWSPDGSLIAFGSTPITPAEPPRERSATLQLGRHLVARGEVRLAPNDFAYGCIENVPVKVQRLRADGWRTVERVVTDAGGSFKTRMSDRPGFYRAVIPEVQGFAASQPIACLRTVTDIVRHTHQE